MPTLRGWIVGGLGFTLACAGRLMGTQLLVQLGFALALLPVTAAILLRHGRPELEVTRDLSPPRVKTGETVTVSVRMTNKGPGAAPPMLLEDHAASVLTGTRRFAVSGIEPSGSRMTSFTILAARRGRHHIGPLSGRIIDPFEVAGIPVNDEARTELLVHPRVEPLHLPPDLGDRRSMAAATGKNPSGTSGQDFYTLREYVEGDDLRRLHWPSTAKRATYMVRQDENPSDNRATILLDNTSAGRDDEAAAESFERSVEAAASLVELYHRAGYSCRLASSVEPVPPHRRGSGHLDECLDRLAVIDVAPSRSDEALLLRLAELDSTPNAEAVLVVVTRSLGPGAAAALGECSRRFAETAVICFPPHRFGSLETKFRWEGEQEVVQLTELLARRAVRVTALGPDETLSAGWTRLWRTERSSGGKWGPRPELV